MASASHAVLLEVGRALESEIGSRTYEALFAEFTRLSALAGRLEGWPDLIAALRDRRLDREHEDVLLLELIARYREERGALWHTLLTLVFYPALCRAHREVSSWAGDRDDLWSDLHWCLIQVLLSIPADELAPGVGGTVFTRTLNRTRHLIRSERRHTSRESAHESPGDHESAIHPITATDESPGAGEGIALVHRALGELLREGAIGETDMAIFTAFRIEGRRQSEVAREAGIRERTVSYKCRRMELLIRSRLGR